VSPTTRPATTSVSEPRVLPKVTARRSSRSSFTRKTTFFLLFLVQAILFWFLPSIAGATVITVVAFVILMCYGGGFGTMPAFAADYFGSKNIAPIYGLMLTAWGFASAFGPLLIAQMRQTNGTYNGALHVLAGVAVVSMVLPLIVSPPQARKTM